MSRHRVVGRTIWRATAGVCVMAIAACISSRDDIAPLNATLSAAGGAPGYMIVGIAEKNTRCEFGAATQMIMLRFRGNNGKNLVPSRSGCQLGTDNTAVKRRVLQVPAGSYRADEIYERLAVFVTTRMLSDEVRNALPVEVKSGSVVYAGDYVFAADFDAQEIRLVRVDHDTAGAADALSEYPSLRGATVVDGGGLRVAR